MADEDRSFSRNAVGRREPDQPPAPREAYAPAGDLGEGTPAGVDIHNLGQEDHPEQDWGAESEEGATFSSNNTRKGIRTEAERGQGAKTRRMTKDIISRRT